MRAQYLIWFNLNRSGPFILLWLCLMIPSFASGQAIPFASVEQSVKWPVLKIQQTVHFMSAAGDGDAVIEPGFYKVEAVDTSRLKLMSIEQKTSLLIQAVAESHAEDLAQPLALAISQGDDEYHVVLLIPGGERREAIGTLSGVRKIVTHNLAPLAQAQLTPQIDMARKGFPAAGERLQEGHVTKPTRPNLPKMPVQGTENSSGLVEQRQEAPQMPNQPPLPPPGATLMPDVPLLTVVPSSTPQRPKAVSDLPPPAEKHVVLRTQFVNGKFTVISARVLDGSLVQPIATAGRHVVSVDKAGTLLSVSGVPDPFVLRSSPDPSGKGPQYHKEIPDPYPSVTIEFPQGKLTQADLASLNVELFQFEGESIPSKIDPSSFQSLRQQGRLRSMKKVDMSQSQPLIRDAFRRANIP